MVDCVVDRIVDRVVDRTNTLTTTYTCFIFTTSYLYNCLFVQLAGCIND